MDGVDDGSDLPLNFFLLSISLHVFKQSGNIDIFLNRLSTFFFLLETQEFELRESEFTITRDAPPSRAVDDRVEPRLTPPHARYQRRVGFYPQCAAATATHAGIRNDDE